MTTTQYDIKRSGILQRINQFRALAEQYEKLEQAAAEYKHWTERLAELDREEEALQRTAVERRKDAITHMAVQADPKQTGSVLASVPVIIARRSGEVETKMLHHLDDVEQSVLIERFWEDVPLGVRMLADTPESALIRYGDAKRRGFLRG